MKIYLLEKRRKIKKKRLIGNETKNIVNDEGRLYGTC
jgi:hypothetical protein